MNWGWYKKKWITVLLHVAAWILLFSLPYILRPSINEGRSAGQQPEPALLHLQASITFSMSDIFKTRISEQYSYSEYFTQTYSRLRDPQMFRLNFAYRFGKIDMSLFKRKNTKQDMQGATDGMQ